MAVNIGSLPNIATLADNAAFVAEQQGEAGHVTGRQLKEYARQGVDALVADAKAAAEQAAKAAETAEKAAEGIKDVTADVEAAEAAARAAESARDAANQAAAAADQAAQLAAQQAAAEVEQQLAGYVTDAENAKDAAQSAAGSAAQDAVAVVDTELAGYVAAAQAAQKAAEDARDQAQGIVGGDFASVAYVDQKAADAESNAKKYTDEQLKDVDFDVTADEVTFADGETFQQKYDNGELTGPAGEPGQPGGKGDPGQPGEPGAPATINGVNALTLNATSPIKATQIGDTLSIELDGDLPSGAKASTYTLTTSGWSDNGDRRFKQTITVPGVTTDASQVIMVDAALTGTDLDADAATLGAWGPDDGSGPSSQNVAQGSGTLTFYCTVVPTVNIPVFVGVS